MQRTLKTFIATLLLALAATTAHAGWWIFGQTQEDVTTSYLTLNNIAWNELEGEVTIYRDSLATGEVIVRGRGKTGRRARIGSAQVSIDDGATWTSARIGRDGSFEYRFRPEERKEMVVLVKLTDTAGKANDWADTRRRLRISNDSISSAVRTALDALFAAYEQENRVDFMRGVSDRFAGDSRILDSAIRRDFSLFENISLDYSLNNVTAAAGGKVYVSLNYRRRLESSRYGTSLADTGMTEFVFISEGDSFRVFSLKNPLLFGLSEAESVATGTVNSPQNSAVIGVTSRSDIILHPVGEEPGSSVPAPTNLRVVPGSTYPIVSLFFDSPTPLSASTHEVQVQASQCAGSGFVDVDANDAGYGYSWAFSASGVENRIDFVHGTCSGAIYRIAIRNSQTGDLSAWSSSQLSPGP